MDVVKKITEAIDILNEVDVYSDSLNDRLNTLNSKQQDILHYIENNRINVLCCYNLVKTIKDIRMERRQVKKDIEMMSKFESVKNRIISKDNRPFILSELHKKEKQLDTVYKNRQYTEEDMKKILTGGKNE